MLDSMLNFFLLERGVLLLVGLLYFIEGTYLALKGLKNTQKGSQSDDYGKAKEGLQQLLLGTVFLVSTIVFAAIFEINPPQLIIIGAICALTLMILLASFLIKAHGE